LTRIDIQLGEKQSFSGTYPYIYPSRIMSSSEVVASAPTLTPPMPTTAATNSRPTDDEDDGVYQYLVVDSGPIIRLSGMSTLWKRAKKFYCVPAVLQEIRDAKARQHLDTLPFELIPKEASPEAIQAVIDFARQTGDYQSLSSVDLQVLGLLYDLEREGCGDMSHVRKTPKRTLGLGKIQSLGQGGGASASVEIPADQIDEEFEAEEDSYPMENEEEQKVDTESVSSPAAPPQKPKTWANLLNPSTTSTVAPGAQPTPSESRTIAEKGMNVTFGQMNLSKARGNNVEDQGGQFSDAEEDSADDESESDSDFDPDQAFSDEECDVYILDPEEADDIQQEAEDLQKASTKAAESPPFEEDLQSEFPSLAASLQVKYEGSDDEGSDESDGEGEGGGDDVDDELAAEEERKRRSRQPVSNSGKLYNSFRKYGNLMKPATPSAKKAPSTHLLANTPTVVQEQAPNDEDKNRSRIIGGMAFSGQGGDVEDDGEGWITTTKEINSMKAAGALDPMRDPKNLGNKAKSQLLGPPTCQRAACTTTDFAMQNVILQMNLELLSVDGIKIRKLKSWVQRCGACFKVYTNSENAGPLGSKRLFCDHCGSDMMQRIAASVDGKTGRLRLHLSKNYKHNLRGTKFSLPKAGTGNRFQGDLLLREDQLLMGAWNQKVKMRSGGKARNAAQSMFGRDIATNVGCHASAVNTDDVRVGFGRRNPNAAKGRERRGKKKKSADKACGLRRY
jgi:RNA-binding protein NOB1